MLVRYFLLSLYYYFLLFCCLLTLILTSSNVLLKLSFAHIVTVLPLVFVSMLPLMLLFAIPISSAISVCLTIQHSIIRNEVIFLHYAKRAKRALIKAIVIFSGSLLLLYIPLVLEWAPSSYSSGKKMLVNIAKKHIFKLKPNMLHTNIPGVAVFFKEKKQTDNKTMFKKLLLSFKDRNNEHYFFSSKYGILSGETIILKKGSSCYTGRSGEEAYGTFETTTINLASLFKREGPHHQQSKQVKLLSWSDLLKSSEEKVVVEKYKRVAQIIWQSLFPFLAFLGIFILASLGTTTFISSIGLSGFLFLVMYTSLALGQTSYHSGIIINAFMLYACIIVITMLLIFLYRKKASL